MNLEKNERLRLIMKKLRLSQMSLSEAINVGQPDISKMYNDKKQVGDSVCWALSCIFSISPQWLEYGKGDMFIAHNGVENTVKGSEIVFDMDAYTHMGEDLKTMRADLATMRDIIEDQRNTIAVLKNELKNKDAAVVRVNVSER